MWGLMTDEREISQLGKRGEAFNKSVTEGSEKLHNQPFLFLRFYVIIPQTF